MRAVAVELSEQNLGTKLPQDDPSSLQGAAYGHIVTHC